MRTHEYEWIKGFCNMDWNLAGAVILSGLVIVFAILIILILVVVVTGNLMNRNATKPKPPAPPPASATPTPPPAASQPAPPSSASIVPGVSGETVAVISAAVAAIMDETAPGTPYAITGIQRDRGSRPVWGFAGMQQNTRPF